MSDEETNESGKEEFADLGAEERVGLFREFLDFLAHNKKWWLLPIVAVLLLLGLLLIIGGSGAAPFIYTLF